MCSSFKTQGSKSTDAERLIVSGSTCDAYLVSIYGKLHFLKRLKPELAAQPRYVVAFRKEFETGFALNHPALPRYVSFLDDQQQPAIIEEYVEGKTLTEFLIQEPNYFHNRKHAKKFIAQLLSVLAYLHSHQILFLDLKPDNIMVTDIGRDLRLVDLGFCYSPAFKDSEGMTPQFAAPEQLQGKAVDERTDVYLFGKLLEYCSMPYIYNKVERRCLNTDPVKRYSNMNEVAKAARRAERKPRIMAISAFIIAAVITLVFILSIPNQSVESSTKESQTVSPSDTILTKNPTKSSHTEKLTIPVPTSTKTGTHDVGTGPMPVQYPVQQQTNPQSSNSNPQTPNSKLQASITKEMNRIYSSTLAQFENEEAIATKDFSVPFDKFIAESEALKKALSTQYPDIPYATVSTEVDRYTSQLLYPIYIKVTK